MRKLMRGLFVVVFFSAVLAWSWPEASPQQPPAKPDQSKYGRYIISKDILKVVPEGYTGILSLGLTKGVILRRAEGDRF